MKINLTFNKNIYSKEALIKAAYQFIDMAYIHLDEKDEYFLVDITLKDGSNIKAEELEAQFENEMLIEQTRKQVADKTHKLRETIFARAMASTIIEGPEEIESLEKTNGLEESADKSEILVDWFEKYE